jgi:hypothetical protein
MRLRKAGAYALLAGVVLLGSLASAQSPPFTQVQTVAASTSAVPLEFSFTLSNSGTYQITLTDLGAQLPPTAPLAAVALAITGSGGAIVGTPLTSAGTVSFTGSPGSYQIHVVGNPGTVPGSGPVGVTITQSTQALYSFSGTLALPAGTVANNEGILQGSFTVPASGNYQVTLSDLQFPAALGTVTLALVVQGGSLVTTLPAAGTNTVALQSGVTYDVFAVGQAGAAVNGGLYGVTVSPAGGGTPAYASATAVGGVTQVANPTLATGSYTLSVADLALPAALTQLGAVVTLSGQAVAQLNAGGSAPFTATANTYQVFSFALPGNSGAGSYALSVQPATGPPAVSIARAVTASGNGANAYSFDTSVSTAGSYNVDVADFAYPAAFTSISAAAVQGGVVLGSETSAGSFNITPSTGPISLVVFAQAASGGGLFGVDLTASGASSATFSTTQGVGQLFSVQQLSIPTAGSYQVTVSDIAFPAKFENLGVIVTQGSSQVGEIFVSGAFNFQAAAGNYNFSFVAQPNPNSTIAAGTYALSVTAAAPTPTVTLTSSASSVSSGGTVQLTWSSQNATGCQAAGGWSGTKGTSGSATSAAITTTTSFTLTCSGAGGSKAATVTVSVAAATPSSGGGGGALSIPWLVFLAGLLLLRAAALVHLRLHRRRS